MSEQKWQCIVCDATARIDVDTTPISFHALYPAQTGPFAERRTAHDCPIQNGLLPEQLELAPNAKRVG